MKIESIRLYQSVQLANKHITHLSIKNPGLAGITGPVSMDFIEGMGVLVQIDTQAVIISFNNLAAIYVDKSTIKSAAKEITKEQAPTLKKLAK